MAHSASIDFLDSSCQEKRDNWCIERLYSGCMDIPKWVRAARKHKNFTQEQLATRLNLTKANISAWETGRHQPGHKQLVMIATLTGYPLMPQDQAAACRPAQIDDLFPTISPDVWGGLSEKEKNMVELKLHEAIQAVKALRREDPRPGKEPPQAGQAQAIGGR